MSYYVRICTLSRVWNRDIFPSILRVKTKVKDSVDKILEENFCYRPSCFKELEYENYQEYLSDELMREKTINWINELFSIRFYYFSSLEILGFILPTKGTLGYPCVHFQNSCDQDYERECYERIPAALDVFDYVCRKVGDTYEGRTEAYKDIEIHFRIKEILRGEEDDKHWTLTVNTIDSEKELRKIKEKLDTMIWQETFAKKEGCAN